MALADDRVPEGDRGRDGRNAGQESDKSDSTSDVADSQHDPKWLNHSHLYDGATHLYENVFYELGIRHKSPPLVEKSPPKELIRILSFSFFKVNNEY